jgi:RNA polymerase sigma-70 factor (ECF subfamily)
MNNSPRRNRARTVVAPWDEPSARTPNGLLAAAAEGDQHAFARFHDHVVGRVLSLVGTIVPDRAAAEELTQEIMIELWRTAGHHSPEQGDAVSWAMGVAHRRAVDRVRSMPPTSTQAQPPAPPVLAQLRPEHREVLVLAYYRGRTYREIGEALRLPVATVRQLIRDGLVHCARHVHRPADVVSP